MCSIGGWISSTPLHRYTAQNLARALLFYGRGRGMQSGGLAYADRIVKRALDPSEVMDLPDIEALFESDSNICLTHTRQPTCGGRGDAQAQPFTHGDATTVHNGWYFDTGDIKRLFNIKKPSGVDSELACRLVSAHGPYKLPDFISQSSGASAIACKWKDELFLMRSGNPIVYMHLPMNDGGKITIFGSTHEQVRSACQYVWLLDAEDMAIKVLKEGILWRCHPGKLEQLTKKPVSHDESFGYGGTGWRSHRYYSDYYPGAHSNLAKWEAGDTSKEISDNITAEKWLDEEEYVEYLTTDDSDIREQYLGMARERREAARSYIPVDEGLAADADGNIHEVIE